ncbi:MAG TPA: hypothetical protein VFN67_33140, partial [Polyangiales bacterium]|nr:hypothetical protein [Polyangiales bacterium]
HPGHNLLLGWIANRNAIVSTTFAVLGLVFQVRNVDQAQGRRRFAAAVLCYAIALASSEYAIGYLAYGAMLTAVRARSPRARSLGLCGWAGSVLAYVVLRGALGYGTRGSGMYIDPMREPVAFIEAAAQHFPVLVGDAVFALRSTWWSGGFPWAGKLFEAGWVEREVAIDLSFFRDVQVGLGVAACVVALAIAAKALRSPGFRDNSAGFALVLGLPLAFIPALASLPESRLMLPPLLGWTVLIASVVTTSRKAGRLGFLIPAALTLLEATAPLTYALDELRDLPEAAKAVRQSMLTPSLDQVAGDGKIVFLSAAVDPTTTIYVPLVRSWYGHAGPSSCQLLTGGYGPLRLTRVKTNEFVVERLENALTTFDVYASAFNRDPLAYGQRFRAGNLEVEVLRTDAGRPMVARFILDRTLDAPEVVLLTQTERGLLPIAFPPVGQNLVIPAAALPVSRALAADSAP